MNEFNKNLDDEDKIMFADTQRNVSIDAIPTGLFSLDYVFACGGLPRGRMVEVFGAEGSGKSTLAMFIAGKVIDNGGSVLWVDAEHTFNKDHAQKLGMNTSNLLVFQPKIGELGLESVRKFAESNAIDLAVIDSVAALLPEAEAKEEISKNSIALQARMMSKAMRILAPVLSKSTCSVVFINQLREKVGVMYGKPTDTPGGKALKYNASVRLEVKVQTKERMFKDSAGNVIGTRMNVKAVKNKVGMPFREADIDVYFMTGADVHEDVVNMGVHYGLIEQSGGHYTYNGEKKHGKDNLKKYIVDNVDVFTKLKQELENYGKNKEKTEEEKGGPSDKGSE